jgi:GNAT superfamily N-acetyltransferase
VATLRRFETTDAPACREIINAAIGVMDGLNAAARTLVISKNGVDAVSADLARCFTLVAVDGDAIVALAALDGSEVRRVYVRREHQRRGLGRLLVQALEAEARRQGLAALELQASPSSVAFYRSLGYRELGRETSTNGAAQFVHVRMSRELGPLDGPPERA